MNKKELIKSVNDYDKSFGIDLKRPEVFSNPSVYKEILLLRVDTFITKIVCEINGIDYNKFLTETTLPENNFYDYKLFKSEDVMTKKFTDLSDLKWDSDEKYNKSSEMFRYRFITIVLYKLLGNIGIIAENIIKNGPENKRHSVDEQSIIIIKEIFENILTFTKIIIDGSVNYGNIILKINEYLSYIDDKKENTKKYNIEINKTSIELRNNISYAELNSNMVYGLFTPTETGNLDDIIIYNILKLCTYFSIRTTSDKYVPDFKYIKNSTRYHDLIKLIQEIGENVLRKTNGVYPPLLYSFVNASPKVKSEYNTEAYENESVRVGLLLLEFVDFILDTTKASNFIKEMKRKGM